MADIRKRTGAKGITYQVRFPSGATKSGYTYRSFSTRKEALDFVSSGHAKRQARGAEGGEIRSVTEATAMWLDICEKEGLNGKDPVTAYTLQNYRYRSSFIESYDWPSSPADLRAPDIVAFRSHLLRRTSRELASKVLSTLHSVLQELMIRGFIPHNPAVGISVRASSRYDQPIVIPSKQEVVALLCAADELANSRNKQIARTWQKYRPMLYLAVDSGMRPQEYLALSHAAIREKGVFVERAISGCGTEITVPKTAAGRRFIDLSPDTLEMIRHYAEHHSVPNAHGLVFPTANGRWQSRRNWQRRGFDVACQKAGLVERNPDGSLSQSKYRPYDLRHFYASMLIEKEPNLKRIQALMGHNNIETTLNVYGHLIEGNNRESKNNGILESLH